MPLPIGYTSLSETYINIYSTGFEAECILQMGYKTHCSHVSLVLLLCSSSDLAHLSWRDILKVATDAIAVFCTTQPQSLRRVALVLIDPTLLGQTPTQQTTTATSGSSTARQTNVEEASTGILGFLKRTLFGSSTAKRSSK